MFENILTIAQALQKFNEDVKPGMKYNTAKTVRSYLQDLKVDAQKLRTKINELRKTTA